jgi:DNA-binding NarL/FixJ family response regulator
MKLLLADDHTLFRDALYMYIERAEPDSAVSIARDLHEALEILKREGPGFDLVLLDLGMPGMNGLEGLKKVQAAYPGIRVAIISGTAGAGQIQAALDLGAAAYFSKTMQGKAMIAAIREVVAGGKYVAMDEARLMPSNYDGGSADAGASGADGRGAAQKGAGGVAQVFTRPDGAEVRFTPRERDVLGYLTGGASNKEIARALNLQVVTVKLHVRGICRKLDARNRTQAALMARALGIAQTAAADNGAEASGPA